MRSFIFTLALLFAFGTMFAQHDGHDHGDHTHETTATPAASQTAQDANHDTHDAAAHGDAGHGDPCAHHEEGFDPSNTAFHHIGDQNIFTVFGDIHIPLPCFLYGKEDGFKFLMPNRFNIGHHGNGHAAIDRYVLAEGSVGRIQDVNFPKGEVAIDCISYGKELIDGKEREVVFANYQGTSYKVDKKSTLDGGLLGGGLTSFYDFSITKNVFTILLTFVLLFFLFRSAANAYRANGVAAPKGTQSFLEPIFVFIRDEVAVPFLGAHKYEKFLPFLMSIFFFILGLNLVGQLPFFPGSANVTGNLSVTMGLAIFAFLVTNLNGNSHYWQHIFWMPGVPTFVRLILTPVEMMGTLLKPITLMLRLFANITAGHMIIICFVGLIFIFGDAGRSIGGSVLGGALAVPLTLFMMAIELIVAFVQAFVFTILTASYIGAAIEEHHEHH